MPIGVFPYRRTVVTLDDYPPSVVQPWIAVQRPASQVARTATSEISNVAFIPGIGWRLKAYQASYADAQELTAAAPGVFTVGGGLLTVAGAHEEEDAFGKADLSGVTYGAGVQDSGSPFVQKRVAAGDSWEQRLSGDQSAYGSPDTGADPVSMDRVATSTGNHEPWDALLLNFSIPAGAIVAKAWVVTFYFCGPAGADVAAVGTEDVPGDPQKLGTGRYALKLRGDGIAWLFEKLVDGSWKYRFQFKWDERTSPAGGRVCNLHVVSDAYQDAGGAWQGSRITFIPVAGFGDSYQLLLSNLAGIAAAYAASQAGKLPIYNVPRLANQPTTQDRIRLDVSREVRAKFQIAKHIYPESGYLVDDVVSFDVPVTPGVPLFLYWRGILPSGTSWEATVYDAATGSALTPATSVTTNGGISYQSFTPSARMRHVKVKIAFTSNGAFTRTPTLQEYALYRSPVYQENSPVTPVLLDAREVAPALARRMSTSVSITPQETDPSAESAQIEATDFTGELANLRQGQMRPITVATEYLVTGEKSYLFQGYVMDAEGAVSRTSSGRNYPSKNWRRFSLSCVGEWARLYEAIAQRRLPWVDPSSNLPFKVTDIIRILLGTVYPDSMIDVFDSEIRLFTSDSEAYITEPGTRIADAIKSLADDYLGAYLLFDANAGACGMWRLLPQKAPPYNNLAIFEISHPGVMRLPHFSPAYGTTMVGDQEVTHTYIVAKTYRESVDRAEGNVVVCYGAGVGKDAGAAGKQDAGLLTQMAVQVGSFNFLGLDPMHANYPDGSDVNYYGRYVPIKVVDFKLSTQAAVNWKTRRVFDRACYSRKIVRFRAPLILVTDVDDLLQTTPRPLRYYDAVMVRNWDGDLEQYLVLSCAPSYTRDGVQMANYVLVTQSNISTVGVMPPSNTGLDSVKKMVNRLSGQGMYAQGQYSPQRAAEHLASEAMGLPENFADALQDLDPDSPTFGEFRYMLDYAPLG